VSAARCATVFSSPRSSHAPTLCFLGPADFGKEKAVALPDVSAQEVEAHLKALYDFGEKQPKAAGKFVVQ
jgi:hypothetical protein